MGTHQAHKLITVSLEKIASSRRRRSEMSLHKNLLVTTVIHKARLAIEEDRFYHYNNSVQYQSLSSPEIGPMEGSAAADASNCYSVPMREIDEFNQHAEYDSGDEADEEMVDNEQVYINEMSEERMDWMGNNNLYQLDAGDDKENTSPAHLQEYNNSYDSRLSDNSNVLNGMKRPRPNTNSEEMYSNYYSVKRVKTWDPNEMLCNMDQDDSTSHTLRLVSVLSATLSKPSNSTNSSYTWSTPNEMCSKQAKDSVDIALFVNRPTMAIAV